MSARLRDVFDDLFAMADDPAVELQVGPHHESGPTTDLFESTLDDQSVEVSTPEAESVGDRIRVLKDGRVVATSPIEAVMDAFVLVNSDSYRTGTAGLDRHEAPDVLTALDETVFTLRGFPGSSKEKLLLVVISRFIEKRALETDAGRLDAAFQRLSRVADERGTAEVYARLADSGVDVHAYGYPDANPLADTSITVHAGRSERYLKTWAVVFADPDDANPAGMLAVEFDDNVWTGVWTYRPEFVDCIQTLLCTEF